MSLYLSLTGAEPRQCIVSAALLTTVLSTTEDNIAVGVKL